MTTILIAEDDAANRELLARRLYKLGFRVLTAPDGAEAVEKALNYNPDLILMDLSMPIMDGIEAWRAICERTDNPPRIIALTAACIQDVRLACAELDFAAYVEKPYEFSELLQRIDELKLTAAAA